MKLSDNQQLLLRRKKGELNCSMQELAMDIGINRLTLSKIIRNRDYQAQRGTIKKINDWLIKTSL